MSKDIIENKGGVVIKPSNDMFTSIKIKCKRGHLFDKLPNDIIMGEWCDQCDNLKTDDDANDFNTNLGYKLVALNIAFTENKRIGKCVYQYVVELTDRKFVIFKDEDHRNSKELCTNAKSNGYNIIIVEDAGNPNIQSMIWSAIKGNTDFTTIQKERNKMKETCTLTREISSGRDDVGSDVKYAPKPYPSNTKLAVGYIRVSTSMQVQDGFSLEAQEAKIYQECQNRNLFCRALYIDKGISGGSTIKRLGLQEMMGDLSPGEWIVVSSVSRLARDTVDLLSLSKKIETLKCHLVVIDLNLDLTTPSGKLILTLMGSQAQFERELTSERVKTVMTHLKDSGMLRTKPHFGMKLNPNQDDKERMHIRNEEEQSIISKIRKLRTKNPSVKITEFTRILNKSEIKPPRKAKKWYHGTLRVIMEREGIK